MKQDQKPSKGDKKGAIEGVYLFKNLSVTELRFLQIKCELCSKTFASKNSVQKHKIKTFASEVGIMTQCSEKKR